MKSKIAFITLTFTVILSTVLACCNTSKNAANTNTSHPKTQSAGNGSSKKTKPVNSASSPAPTSAVVTVKSDKIKVADYYFGFNTQMIHGPDWSNSKFIAAVKNLHPENLRYPGGTIANYWDWKKGWFFNTPNLPEQFKKVKANPITLENFKLGIDATNAMPVYVLNMLTSDINYQLQMLHHAKDIGLEVKLIELGNEFYGKDENGIAKFPTGKDYALEANKWIVAIKKDFPDARIAVVGCGRSDLMVSSYSENNLNNPKERIGNWDETMFANLRGADAVTFHIYTGPGVQTGKNKVKTNNKKDATAQRAVKDAFDDNVESSLGVPFVKKKQMIEYNNATVPKGMRTWYTEYNLFEKNLVVSGTWTHGLYVALMSVLFLDIDRTEFICNHNIAKGARFAAIFNDDDGFENHMETKKTKPFGFSAGGACLSLVGQAIYGKTVAQELNFSQTQSLKSLKQVTYPSLLGYKFSGNGKESAILFNLSNAAVALDVNAVSAAGKQFKTYSGDPLNQISDDNEITMNTGAVNGSINLPAYSITVVY